MADFAVSMTFRSTDQAVMNSFRRMTSGARAFSGAAVSAFDRAGRSASRFQSITKNLLYAGAIQRGVAMMQEGARNAVQQYMELDDVLIGAALRFDDIGVSAYKSSRGVSALGKLARQIGRETRYGALETAKGMDFLAKAGWRSDVAVGVLRPTIHAAMAAGEEFGATTSMLSDLMGAFGLNVSDTNKRIENYTILADQLTAANNASNVSLMDLFETLKGAAPIGTQLKYTTAQVIGMAAFLGDVGLKGSNAETALKNIMLRTAAITPEAEKLQKSLGVTFIDKNTKNAREFSAIFKDLNKALEGKGTAERAAAMKTFFGMYGIAGSLNFLAAADALDVYTRKVEASTGVSKAMAAAMQDSLLDKFERLKNSALDLGFRFLDAFKVKGATGVDAMAGALDRVNLEPWIAAMNIGLKLMSAVAKVLPLVILGFTLYAGAVALSTARLAVMKLMMPVIISDLIFGTRAVGGFTVMLVRMKAALLGSQAAMAGLATLGIAAVVYGMWELEQRYNFLSDAMNKFETTRTIKNWVADNVFGAGQQKTDWSGRETLERDVEASRKTAELKGQITVSGPPGTTASFSPGVAAVIDESGMGGWN